MPLTAQQLLAVEVLDWVYGEDRRTGRTAILAIWTIRKAFSQPGIKIFFQDHHHATSRSLSELVAQEIEVWLPEGFRNRVQVDTGRGPRGMAGLTYYGDPIVGWLPAFPDVWEPGLRNPPAEPLPLNYWDLIQ